MAYLPPASTDVPDLEVVILNWNAEALLERCLDSILASEPRRRVLITVVDNASTDDSVEMLRRRFEDRVRVLATPANAGFARGNNLALRRCRARYALLLNTDTIVPPGSSSVWDRFIRLMDSAPEVGVLGPRLERPDGTIEESTGDAVSLLNIVKNRILRIVRFPRRITGLLSNVMWTYDRVRDVPWVSGAALMVRGEILRGGCLLDEGYFMYTEDVEWCWRIRRLGWRVRFDPSVTLVHAGHGSAPSEERAARRRLLHRRGLLRFTALHPSPRFLLLRWLLRRSLRRLGEEADERCGQETAPRERVAPGSTAGSPQSDRRVEV